METLILAWYILVETDSPFLLAVVGALRFGGTLLSPVAGVMADRAALRQVMVWLRVALSVLACAIIVADVSGVLGPVVVLIIAAASGLLRPAEHIIRNALIAETVPNNLLANAVGFSRTTSDSARIVGALVGAGLLAAIGIAWAYAVITLMYVGAIALTFGLPLRPPRASAQDTAPLRDLVVGFGYVYRDRPLRFTMFLALLANLTAFPLTHGLLPVVARDLYGLDEVGLASMVAAAATGSLVGSLLVAATLKTGSAARIMLVSMVLWHVLVCVFLQMPPSAAGWVILFFVGVSSSGAMSTMAVSLLHEASAEFRGRVMGVRMLAVYGLPIGLLVAGALIEEFGASTTLTWYGVVGILVSVWVALRWQQLIGVDVRA
tara:strand:- start:772 stop:1902 length:1131 start_codon:yes stop_codon:yes gene_type:complete